MKDKMLHFGHRLISHELIKGSSIVFAGSMTGNILAFLFNLFVVRKLSYASYGEYAALISLLTLATIPAQSISPVIVRFASSYLAKKEEGKAASLYQHMFLFLTFISVVILSFFFLESKNIQYFLHLTESKYIFLVGLSVAVTYMTIINTAFLQSLLRFVYVTMAVLFGNAIKLVLGAFLIILGFQVGGAIWATLIALLITFLLGFIPLQHFLIERHKNRAIAIKEIVVYALPAIISLFSLSSFTSTDVLLVKHFFPANSAGLYAGLSLVGRVIFYFTAPISSVMFPLVVKRLEKKENFQSLLYISFFLVLGPSIAITIFYFIFPKLSIIIFLGGRGYLSIARYIGLYGLFLSCFSVLNVLVNFFLSIKQTNVVYLVALGAILQAILISLFHSNFTIVIFNSLLVTLGLLLLLLLYYYRFYAATKKNL